MRKAVVAVLLFMIAVAAYPASPYSRVLLPLFLSDPAPGAYGSVWASAFVIHNGSATHSYIIRSCPPAEACTADLANDEDLRPNKTETGLPARYPKPTNGAAGTVLWLESPDGSDSEGLNVSYSLRVVDLSRTATAAGTEVPVVRERALRSTTIHLLNVPTDSRFRTALRIFEMNLATADFRVHVFDQQSGAQLFEQVVTTTTHGVTPQEFTPGFAEMSDLVSAGANPIRVEIEPLSAGAAFWAYVSITNNDSQQITLVTPQ